MRPIKVVWIALTRLGATVLLCFSTPIFAFTASYDSLNRLTSVVYSPTQRIDYVYDAAGNLMEERVNGSAGLTVTAQASSNKST